MAVDPDPDSMTLWIRIRNGNPDPKWESGSRGKKIKKNRHFFIRFYFFYNEKI
jgi:hypothetical protein